MAHKKKAVSSQSERKLSRRGFMIGASSTGLLGLLSLRLLYVQGLDPQNLAATSRDSRTRTQKVPAVRGQITDVNGHVLARSVQRYNIIADQTIVAEFKRYDHSQERVTVTPTELVYEVTDILRTVDPTITDDFVKSKLEGDSRYSVIKTNVTPEIYNRIDALGAPFLFGEVISERLYPDGPVGGSVVGRYRIVDEAVEGKENETVERNLSVGIERTFEKELAGVNGKRVYEIGADGVRIPVTQEQVSESVNGKTVRLTLNRDIQYYAQQVMKARVDELKAEWGCAIVMDVRDGSILALADSTTMDPGAEKVENTQDMVPRAISQIIEPGSTEKILTASALIEKGITTLTDTYDVPATLTVNGQTFKDAFEHPAQRRTFSGIITDSMNTGTVLVGQKMPKEERYEWLKKYGMGEFTGIDIAGEQQGLVSDWKTWDGRQEFTVFFGHGLAQTPLQTAMVFQAVGNLGVKVKPRIVDAIIDPDGTEHKVPVEGAQRVVSEKTARDCLTLMENVVTKGQAKLAQVNGYRVGGKTGTAEAPSEKGGYEGYATSFIGVAPIENPRFMVSITLQRPKGEAGTIGGTGQFSQIMERVLHTYNIPHSTTEPHIIPIFADGKNSG